MIKMVYPFEENVDIVEKRDEIDKLIDVIHWARVDCKTLVMATISVYY